MAELVRVFLSSTSKDLQRVRDAVIRGLRKTSDIHVVGMEDFPAHDASAVETDARYLDGCSLFIGLLGPLYGSTPTDQPGDTSYTEREYEEATRHCLPRLMFLTDDDFPVPQRLFRSEPSWKLEQQDQFRRRVSGTHVVGVFTASDKLATDVVTAVSKWRIDQAAGENTRSQKPPSPKPKVDLTPWLDALIQRTGHIAISGIGSGVGRTRDAARYPIEQLYTTLRSRGDAEADAPDRSLTLGDLMSRSRRLLIEGQPGAGKTTFLKLAATVLARDCLGRPGPQGGHRQDHWSEEGWRFRQNGGWTAPRGWESQTEHPNRPVTGVSWYEAMAYCRWLSAETGRAFGLPTEREWGAAATPDGRTYPWGEPAPDPERANFAKKLGEPNVGHPTPVGIYPAGDGPDGHCDLAGNVWEWCRDVEAAGLEDRVERYGPTKALRGGAWNDPAGTLRAAGRNGDRTPRRSGVVGFRVAAADANTVEH